MEHIDLDKGSEIDCILMLYGEVLETTLETMEGLFVPEDIRRDTEKILGRLYGMFGVKEGVTFAMLVEKHCHEL